MRGIKTTLARVYEKYEKQGSLFIDEMAKYDRLKKFDKEVEKAIREMYTENRSLMNATFRNMFEDTYRGTMGIIEDEAGRRIRGILKSKDVTKTVNEAMAGLNWTERFGRERREAVYKVQQTLKEGMAEGATYRQMTQRLTKAMEGDVINPKRIIRTEGNRIHNQARTDALDHAAAQGVKMKKKWVTADDERVRTLKSTGGRTSHELMHNVTIPYEDDFVLPSGAEGNPGSTGNAGDDINCRCIYVPVLVTEE